MSKRKILAALIVSSMCNLPITSALASDVTKSERVVVNAGDTVTYTDDVVTTNNTTLPGGAVRNDGTFITTGTTIFNNNKSSDLIHSSGGAIYNTGKLIIGDGTQFTNNQATFDEHPEEEQAAMGSAIYSEGYSDAQREITIGNNVVFDGNTAGAGTIFLYGNNNVTIGDGVKFTNNAAKNYGFGAGIVSNGNGTNGYSTVTIGNNAVFSGNNAPFGSAIVIGQSGDSFTIGQNAKIYNNTGRAIDNAGTLVIKDGAMFQSNTFADGNGGALHTRAGAETTISNADFMSNSAKNGGAVSNKGTTILTDTYFRNNTATTNGGAIYNAVGTVTVNASTKNVEFSGNTAAGNSNDIYSAAGTTLNLNTAEGKEITFNGGLDGAGEYTVNVTCSGTVSFDSDVHYANMDVKGGTVELGYLNEDGTSKVIDIANSTINVTNAAISTVDGAIKNYSQNIANGLVVLKDKSSVSLDVNYQEGGSLETDKFSTLSTSGNVIKLAAVNYIDTKGFTENTSIKITDNDVKIEGTSANIYIDSARSITAAGSGEADGKINFIVDTVKKGLDGAVEKSEDTTVTAVNYKVTGNETVNTLGNVGDGENAKELLITGDGTKTITAANANVNGLNVLKNSILEISNVGANNTTAGFTGFGADYILKNEGELLSIENSSFINNNATVIVNNSSTNIKNGYFKGNTKGVIVNRGLVNSDPTTYDGNSKDGDGGAIENLEGATFISDKDTYTNNTATGNGGAIFNAGNLTVTDGTFTGNKAANKGGAIYSSANATIIANSQNVTFSGNLQDYDTTLGGNENDIYMNGATLNLVAAGGKKISFVDGGIDGDNYKVNIGGGTNTGEITLGDGEAATITNAAELNVLSGTLNVADTGSSVSATAISTAAGATIANAGEITGNLTNAGTFDNSGIFTGALVNTGAVTDTANSGTLNLTGVSSNAVGSAITQKTITTAENSTMTNAGTVTANDFTNNGTWDNGTIGAITATNSITNNAGAVLTTVANAVTGADITNDGTLNLTGGALAQNIAGNGTTNIQDTVTSAKSIANDLVVAEAGNFTNQAGGSITGAVTNNGTFTNDATATINGDVENSGTFTNDSENITGTITNNAGTFTNNADISSTVTSIVNNGGTFDNNSDLATAAMTIANNGGTFKNNSTIAGAINNKTGATFENEVGGNLTGAVTNAGTLSNLGTVADLTNDGGTVTNGDGTNNGTITSLTNTNGTVTNANGSTITTVTANNGTLNNDGTITNGFTNDGTLNNTANGSIGDDVINNGTMANAGTISGDVSNAGTLTNDTGATITGNVTNDSIFNNAGNVGGNVINDGTMTNTASGTIDGDVTNGADSTFNNSGSVTGDVENDGTMTDTASAQYNGDVTNNGTWNANETAINNAAGTVTLADGSTLNLANGQATAVTNDIIVGAGDEVTMALDIDMTNGTTDNFTDNSQIDPDAKITLTNVKLNGAIPASAYNGATVDLAATGLPVSTIQNSIIEGTVLTPIRYLQGSVSNALLSYAPTGGRNDYESFNPAVVTSEVAAQVAFLNQLNTYDQAFSNMDMVMLMTSAERQAWKMQNKYAAADADRVFEPTMSSYDRKGAWFRPYASFENVPLKNGPRISNVMYGTFIGGDSPLYDLGNGWDGMFSVYANYNGSHQTYQGNSIYQNGGGLGLTGVAYKGNFFGALTANFGAIGADAKNMYGSEDFTMLATGVAGKAGYNWELANGKFIIQPSYQMAYSFIDTLNYNNAAGVRIKSNPLHAITLEPGIKFIGNLPHGWQPYAGVSVVANILDQNNVKANDVGLPEMSVKPYAKYGVGVRKRWGERLTGFFQTFFTSGGRNGVGFQFGLRWALGNASPSKAKKASNKVPEKAKTNVNIKNV